MLDLSGIGKSFAATRALHDISLAIGAGEVLGLVGHNGAGKSTLIKIVAGAQAPDSGAMSVDGQPVRFASARDAYDAGIRVIHQDAPLVPAFDTVDNCWLGKPYPKRFGTVDRKAMQAAVAAVAQEIAPDLPLDVPVMHLSPAQRQFVRLLAAIVDKGRLLVLDEPTAALPAEDAARFYEVLRRTQERGTSIMLVTHRLDEITGFCARAVVLRDGQMAGEYIGADLTVANLVTAMGGSTDHVPRISTTTPDAPIMLDLQNVVAGELTVPASVSVRAGEVVALYGLSGSGRSSLLNAIWGAERLKSGAMVLEGASYAPKSPRKAVASGISYVPADRHRSGLFADLDLVTNKTLPLLSSYRRVKSLPLPDVARERAEFVSAAEAVSLVYSSPNQPARTLSGGNQQKLLFSRWASRHSRVMLLDEPTEGVDVMAKATIRQIIQAIAADGNAVLVSTSDRDEAMDVADRVLVFRSGALVAQFTRAEATPQALAAAAQSKGRP